jgi:phospholipid/cholesterol/gamma-HCH transport system ATP-binding protein
VGCARRIAKLTAVKVVWLLFHYLYDGSGRAPLANAILSAAATPAEAAQLGSCVECSMSRPLKVRIRGLKKSFGDQVVLADIDLDISHSDNVVLLGISGSGKTVLMKCVLGLMQPDAGSVQIDGQETVGLPRAQWEKSMRKIGVLFQNGALFDSLPIWQNVVFALLNRSGLRSSEARAVAIKALAALGLGVDVADLYPAELSGGMQRRVALTRAIVGGPEMLFLDSPTAGLDPILTAIIDRLIVASLTQLHATALSITHDLKSARRIANRAAYLEDGRIVWAGPIEALDRSGNPQVDRFVRGSRSLPA